MTAITCIATERRTTTLGRHLRLVLPLLVLGTAASPALADVDAEAPRISVSYSRAELATEAGLLEVHERIVTAARRVCTTSARGGARQALERRQCRERAIEEALAQVDSEPLYALHAQRMGGDGA